MNSYFAPVALLPTGWARDVRIDVDPAGTIADIVPASPRTGASLLGGVVVAGMPNAHSHVFQRALAGRTERTADGDSFWGWREAMYAFLERLDPEAFEALAAGAYVEMLKAGYTSVAEFHYLHHGPGGVPYARATEMSERAIEAAHAAGIGLTLLPVLYRFSNFGAVPPTAGQRRFVMTLETFAELWRGLARIVPGDPLLRLGVAPHSLRAVALEDLRPLLAIVDAEARAAGIASSDGDGSPSKVPVHIHISEQVREVEACRALHGTTPIELLAGSVDLGARWSLVHATHATALELARIARHEAVVVVCPTTEANLGDGTFAAAAFAEQRGRIAIGSDSNVTIDVAEELRWLEYTQRLALRKRDALHVGTRGALGDALYHMAAAGGRQALLQPVGTLAVGSRADLVVLEPLDPLAETECSLDSYIFRSGAWRVRDVMVAGRFVVREGRHHDEDRLRMGAARAMQALLA